MTRSERVTNGLSVWSQDRPGDCPAGLQLDSQACIASVSVAVAGCQAQPRYSLFMIREIAATPGRPPIDGCGPLHHYALVHYLTKSCDTIVSLKRLAPEAGARG